jgi:hypothetical protein
MSTTFAGVTLLLGGTNALTFSGSFGPDIEVAVPGLELVVDCAAPDAVVFAKVVVASPDCGKSLISRAAIASTSGDLHRLPETTPRIETNALSPIALGGPLWIFGPL